MDVQQQVVPIEDGNTANAPHAARHGPGATTAQRQPTLPSPPRAPAASSNAAWADYQTIFTNAKAGMEGVDKEHVQRVVYEMSKVRTDLGQPSSRVATAELHGTCTVSHVVSAYGVALGGKARRYPVCCRPRVAGGWSWCTALGVGKRLRNPNHL